MTYQTNDVFGVKSKLIASYIERNAVDVKLFLEVIMFPSTSTGLLVTIASIKSFLTPSHDVAFLPFKYPLLPKIHGPAQIAATTLSLSKKCFNILSISG